VPCSLPHWFARHSIQNLRSQRQSHRPHQSLLKAVNKLRCKWGRKDDTNASWSSRLKVYIGPQVLVASISQWGRQYHPTSRNQEEALHSHCFLDFQTLQCEWEIQEECNNVRKLTLVGGASGGMFSLMCRSLRAWTVVVPPPTTGDDDLCRDAPSPKGSLSHCCCWESDPRMTRARPIPPPFTMSDYLPHLLSETLQEIPLHKRFKP
jgi:hypothetical protein